MQFIEKECVFMYCNQCGTEIPDNSKFCNECGCAVSTNDMTQSLHKDNTEKNIVETNGHTTNNIATKKNLFHNKKFLIASISAVSVVILFAVLIFTHVICLWHDYSDATIIEPQTCRYCDKTKGEPKPLSEIEFPTKGLAALLPTPKSNMGEIDWDNSDSVYIYIGNTTESDFKDYIKECSDKGFDIDYQKGDDYYYADDINGNRLSLHYKENNVMSIQILSPRDDESEDNTSDGESDSSVEEDTNDNESSATQNSDDKQNTTDDSNTNSSSTSKYKKLTESEIKDLAVTTLYKQLLAYENNYHNIDAASCKYKINKIENDNGQVKVYGVVWYYDKYGSVTKFGKSYQGEFTVQMTQYGDEPWCKIQ